MLDNVLVRRIGEYIAERVMATGLQVGDVLLLVKGSRDRLLTGSLFFTS